MKVADIRIAGIRCFDDTGTITCSPKCNILTGRNNVGKSTLLRALLALQGSPFSASDLRRDSEQAFIECGFHDLGLTDKLLINDSRQFQSVKIRMTHKGPRAANTVSALSASFDIAANDRAFDIGRPDHTMVPLLAKRRAMQFDENVSISTQTPVTGTFQNLYSRVDRLATAGHPKHQDFQRALNEIVELPITTRASQNGKQAGMYLSDENSFVTLEQMGDGVVEMVGLIVELCTEERKIFVLEEPETHLHPAGLKSLLRMVREASSKNQFFIATHSNIVLRELGYDPDNKVFRIQRTEESNLAPSKIEEVGDSSLSRISILRELGYEFADLGLHDAWLFLEESSAEQVISKVLVPHFAPKLADRLRTFSAAGATKLDASVSEFQRLVTFVHLQPAYEGRLWIRADNDQPGRAAIEKLRQTFPRLGPLHCNVFSQPAFEKYYPAQFQEAVDELLAINAKEKRQAAKRDLLLKVIRASMDSGLVEDWNKSAAEVIAMLHQISETLT